jgi:glycosyltransferase involved in cell wall biosynthesis
MTVSAIVCAYNEEKTVKPILEVLLSHPRIDEVVVVDDGSTDKTWGQINAVKSPKLIPVKHPANMGKGAAVANGINSSSGEILLFVDADLKKFHPSHIDLLLAPLIIDDSIMSIGVREIGSIFEQNFRTLFRSFGGERAVTRKYVVPLLKRIKVSGYGIEAIVNLNHLHKGKNIVYIPLPRLVHRAKVEKHPIYRYILDYLKENREVIQQYFDPKNKALEAFFKQITKKLGV